MQMGKRVDEGGVCIMGVKVDDDRKGVRKRRLISLVQPKDLANH